MFQIDIGRHWNGELLKHEDVARFYFRFDPHLTVEVDSPYYGDLPPDVDPGRVDRLWDFEVCELFLLGADAQYLEVELGPHGHYLALKLQNFRNVVNDNIDIVYKTQIDGRRWQGWAEIDRKWLPQKIKAAAAFAMHGSGDARQFLAAKSSLAPTPDFHHPDCFMPLDQLKITKNEQYY